MTRRKDLQTPLGELLTKARMDLGWSRAHLSKQTGIAEASLIRYEKAGTEADGQYPPSPKLARLVFELEINPLKALLSCLSDDEFWEYGHKTWETWLDGHPQNEYLMDQFIALNNDNRTLRVLVEALISDQKDLDEHAKEKIEYLKGEARKIFDAQKRYEEAVHYAFRREKVTLTSITIPGNPTGPGFDWSGYDYAEMRREDAKPSKDNGPNPEGSDRLSDPDHPEAAPTASVSTRPERPEENSG